VSRRIIAVIGRAEPIGGAEKAFLALTRGFREQLGREVLLVSHLASEAVAAIGATALRAPGEHAAVMVPRLRTILAGAGPDAILFPFQIRSNVLAIVANQTLAPRARLKVIANDRAHIGSLLGGSRGLALLARWSYRRASRIVCNSRENAEAVRAFLGPRAPPVQTIYNPVDGERIRAVAAAARARRDPARGPLVTAHGRIDVRQKGWDTLVDAFADVVAAVPSARLRIVGDGPDLERVRSHAARVLGEGRLELPGHQADPIPAIAEGDVYVLPSRWEGLPNSLLEAMAAGLPVVAARCPTGPAELLEDGATGDLVPVDDRRALASALITLLGDRELRARRASLAETRARAFTLSAAAAGYAALFEAVAAEHQAAGR
jgi:glycosyltransferase involved in cell wall biosynthesis